MHITNLFSYFAVNKKQIAMKSLTNKYGAQNEVYNDDWAENGLIVLCFS